MDLCRKHSHLHVFLVTYQHLPTKDRYAVHIYYPTFGQSMRTGCDNFECANKFGGPIYFPSNLEHSNELQKHMHHGYSSPCLPWLKKSQGFPWKSELPLWFAQCACSSSPVQTPVRWKYEKQNQWVLSDQITHHFIMTSFQWEMLNCTICMDILLQKNINLWHFQPNMSKTLYWEKL